MQERPLEPSWTVLILKPHPRVGDRPVAALNPVPPKDAEAAPRYACSACRHILLTGMPLVELKQRLKQRTGRDDVAIRCPACDALNALSVGATARVAIGDAPAAVPVAAPDAAPPRYRTSAKWHISGAGPSRS
jgi:hypothetical protein